MGKCVFEKIIYDYIKNATGLKAYPFVQRVYLNY